MVWVSDYVPFLTPSSATHAVHLAVNADGGSPNYSPPERLLSVSVVADIAFLELVSYDEDNDTTTTKRIGPCLAVDLRALLYALASQSPVEFARIIAQPGGGQ